MERRKDEPTNESVLRTTTGSEPEPRPNQPALLLGRKAERVTSTRHAYTNLGLPSPQLASERRVLRVGCGNYKAGTGNHTVPCNDNHHHPSLAWDSRIPIPHDPMDLDHLGTVEGHGWGGTAEPVEW